MGDHHPAPAGRARVRIRAQLNRIVVVCSLVVVLPMVALVERVRAGAGRRAICGCIRVVGRLCGLRFEVLGRERLDPSRPYVFVPNHSSFLDIPALLLADDQVRFLAAAGLFKIPLLAGAMRAMGTERIDRRDPRAAYQELAALAARGAPGRLVIFPEGRIAPVGRPLPFKNGAFVFALETGTAVVPVAVHGSGELLGPGARLAVRPGLVRVEFRAPIESRGFPADGHEALRDRARAAVVDALLTGPNTAGVAR